LNKQTITRFPDFLKIRAARTSFVQDPRVSRAAARSLPGEIRIHRDSRADRREALVDYFLQTTHPGTIQLHGETASGRAYLHELIRLRDGSSHLNYAIYHDRYQRTGDGWKFTERVYEIRYLDTTALAGSVPAVPRSN